MATSPEMRPRVAPAPADDDAGKLPAFFRNHPRIAVLTGAGCSPDSGIPDYRDADGGWKHRRPMQFAEFRDSEPARRRYWARSLAGWQRVRNARPNPAHRALSRLEAAGRITAVITQNVDGLHQAAGSRRVIDLHGRIDRVVCLGCRRVIPRERMQSWLLRCNPQWPGGTETARPDGDADPGEADCARFHVPECPECSGVLKPDVVFFGEGVPRSRVETSRRAILSADALLVVGSSLMVWSGYRFARLAAQAGRPVAAVNLGRTRADAILAFRAVGGCGPLLSRVVDQLDEP